MTLRFNSRKAADSFRDMIDDIASDATFRFYHEATMYYDRGVYMDYDDSAKFYIHDYVTFGAAAIMQSFGTGSEMDRRNRYLDEYMSSPLWNRLRTGFDVVGREEGAYTNIFGQEVHSKGEFPGTSIEKTIYHPQKPSGAIQDAEKWLEQKGGWLDKEIDWAVNIWIENEMPKFFEYI